MPPLPNYLYQYPQSKNFFFRIRIPRRITAKYYHKPLTFIASLQCSKLEQARWLALFINARFKRDWEKMMDSKDITALIDDVRGEGYSESRKIPSDFQNVLSNGVEPRRYEPQNWDFRAYLKQRYVQYLAMAKDAIRSEIDTYFDINQFTELADSDVKRYEAHLKSTIEKGDSSKTFGQLAHKSYLLSYLNDYEAYLKSPQYQQHRKSETEALELPINLNTASENAFKTEGYSQDYFKAFGIETDGELDKYAINRFIARHGWLEFNFKRQLIREISNFSADYDQFTDEEYEPKHWSPAQWRQYEDIFSTYSNTLTSIKDLKREERQDKRNKKQVKLKDTFTKFINEKKRSVKEDTVMQYQISFNFFFELLGDDYDLTLFNKTKAVEIKNSVMDKAANSEKGRDKEKLAVKTINRYLTNLGAFLNWCHENNLGIERDLFTNLKLKETKASKNRRRPYNKNEIMAVRDYQPKNKTEAKDIREDAYWFPKVALYTGMRLNEISYLTADDFGIENGIHYISLFDKDLKTESSERKFPIHSKLIEYGLLDLVEKRKKSKNIVLFQQIRIGKIKPNKYGWGEKASRWFNRSLLKNIGIDKDSESNSGFKVDFHGLRTTFISECKRKGLNGYIVKQIVGHLDDDDITFNVYGSEVSTKLSAMKDLIEEIDY
jgi:integrase